MLCQQERLDFKAREEERGNEEIFWRAALFISHYMRVNEESRTDSATFDDNALHFCFFLRQSDGQASLVLLSVVQNCCISHVHFNLAENVTLASHHIQ